MTIAVKRQTANQAGQIQPSPQGRMEERGALTTRLLPRKYPMIARRVHGLAEAQGASSGGGGLFFSCGALGTGGSLAMMKMSHLSYPALVLAGVHLFSGILMAQKADPYAYSIQVYQLPASELITGFVSEKKGRLRAPNLPPPSASHGELEAFLKRDHEVMKEWLDKQGIALPPGSLACYDPATQTLALRSMSTIHDMMQPLVQALLETSPAQLAWTLEIVEAPGADVRQIMAEAVTLQNHQPLLEDLLAKGASIVTMRGETKAGQRTVSTQGLLREVPTEYEVDEKNRANSAKEQIRLGTEIELDPVISHDHREIDINVRLKHQTAPLIQRWDRLTAGSSPALEAQWSGLPVAELTTSTTLLDRETRLLGVWSLDADPNAERRQLMRAAFLRAAVVHILPLPGDRALQILTQRGEAVTPTPKNVRPVADPALPPGMQVRRFRIRPDFLSSGSIPATAADPFAGAAADMPSEPRFRRSITVEEILKSYGIPFPEGATANYLASSSELLVRNTPENLLLVEEYLESLSDSRPRILRQSLHIVEAGAALLRQVEKDSFGLPDHAAAWQTVQDAATQGNARIVRSLWLEGKGGQRSKVSNVIEHHYTTELSLPGPSQPAADDKTKPSPGRSLLGVLSEMMQAGTTWEVDPVIGADARTIDINWLLRHHPAPSTLLVSDEAPPEGVHRLAVPQWEYPEHQTDTAITLLSGSTRLLALWKPDKAEGDVMQAVFLRADVVTLEAEK